MKIGYRMYALTLAVILAALAACGVQAVDTPQASVSAKPQASSAALTLSTHVTGSIPAGTIATGYDLALSLPSGVTVTNLTAIGSAAGSHFIAAYSSAADAAAGQVRIIVVNSNGFAFGAFCKVQCAIADGVVLNESDFGQSTIVVSGYDTSTDTTVDLTGQVALTESVILQ